jgi:predicted nucleic acid-binding protein
VILVDSSVWIAHLRGSLTPATVKLEAAVTFEPILVGDLILLEVLQGARDELAAARIERGLRRFEVVPLLDADLAPARGAELSTSQGYGNNDPQNERHHYRHVLH